ncbi:hypothetical protein QU487_10990 [Crenobacter sp. SG2305]|uniref:bestrophin-like domain n=1 Tax=Crenobacter oryzisoli TaxID=3056844 RepID=UPI0025AA3426|nr:hypothetical protein [Crenobacter sp. SG2305]MDN0083274.1 hypothetical protein [Crenobacter sp. SG2305]
MFAIAGICVHELFPSAVAHSGDLIKSISGLIGTLFAIVLGLLVSSSYATFNNHQADLNSLVNSLANIDLLLKQFKAVSNEPRILLREVVLRLLKRYWPDENGVRHSDISYSHLAEDAEMMLEINGITQSFENIARDDLNSIREFSSGFIAVQSNIIRSLSNQIPTLLLVVVFGWACLLFFLYGVLSGGGFFSIFSLLLGVIAITSTNFLMLELTHPYQGTFKVSSAAFDLLLDAMTEA